VATQPRGFGRQFFGPGRMGAGGPLTVVRALAVASHVARVVYNEEPIHVSPGGTGDALNPSNYVFGVPGGNATAPATLAVDTNMHLPGEYGVGNGGATGERGFDVHTDVALVFGVLYLVTVQGIQSLAGGGLGTPDSADFGGVQHLAQTKLTYQRPQDLVDILQPVATGSMSFAGGDIALDTPDGGTKVRVFRRMFTRKNAFKALPGYGTSVDLKSLGSPAKLAGTKTDMLGQIKSEPDVAAVQLFVSQASNGLTTFAPTVQTRRGTFVDSGGSVSALGQVSPAGS
jgi:hypothetical protein